MSDINAERKQMTKAVETQTGRRFCNSGMHYVPVEDGGVWVRRRGTGAKHWRCAHCIRRRQEAAIAAGRALSS